MMELPPSQIRYSQATISTVFDRKSNHSNKPIEDTLNAICEGRQSISSIPLITVCRYNDQWYTRDNRRLWVFKHLEALGKCTTISVYKTERSNVDNRKFTTSNEGISVGFRTPFAPAPSGDWYKKAESLLSAINDRISQSASKSGNETDSPVCELKTDASSESDAISTDDQDSAAEIDSTLESSNSSSNGECIPNTPNQEDSIIYIRLPGDHSRLDPLDDCKYKVDRKDAINGKLQSDDAPTGNDAETEKNHPLFDEKPNKHSASQLEQVDQYQKGNQDQSQNDGKFVCHNQKYVRDQIFNQQLEVSQTRDHPTQDERKIMESGDHEVESSLKRSHAGVEEEPGCFHVKIMRTDSEQIIFL